MGLNNDNRSGVVDYSKQAEMDEDLVNVNVRTTMIIVGTGGIGFWLGIHACMLGFKQFILFDGDSVDRTNLNRLPLKQQWLGKKKVVALKHTMRSMRPDIAVHIVPRNFNVDIDKGFISKINNEHSYGYANHLFDCTDNAFTQKALFAMCKEFGNFIYSKLGYEGYNIGAYTDYSVWVDEEGYESGYRTSKANSISSSVVASLGLLKAITRRTNDMDVDILKLVGGGYREEEV